MSDETQGGYRGPSLSAPVSVSVSCGVLCLPAGVHVWVGQQLQLNDFHASVALKLQFSLFFGLKQALMANRGDNSWLTESDRGQEKGDRAHTLIWPPGNKFQVISRCPVSSNWKKHTAN